MEAVEVSLDSSAIISYVDEVNEIAERRSSFPEILDCLLQIRDGLQDGVVPEGDLRATGTNNFVLSLKVGQPLLDLLVALRTLDRDLELVG